jgi:archaeal flagellar protein FlaF
METAITALIVAGILILAILGLSFHAISVQATISENTRTALASDGERARTNLTVLDAATAPDGSYVQVTLKNTGSTRLSDFSEWDVFLQYWDGTVEQLNWYAYGVAQNQWNEIIYQDAATLAPEVIEPGILNPGEEIVVTVNIAPPVAAGTTNLAAISTPNGVTASAIFTH